MMNKRSNRLNEVKSLMGKLDPEFRLLTESADYDKTANVRDINIEKCRRVLIEALRTNGRAPLGRYYGSLTDNPDDYMEAPGGMNGGMDDNGNPFPQWPGVKVGDPAVFPIYGNSPVPVYSDGYEVPSEVNYDPGYGAKRTPNGKYELNGRGHDEWMVYYTPLLNAIMNNFSACKRPIINGVDTYAALPFILGIFFKEEDGLMRPESVFRLNKMVKYMAKSGYFDEQINEMKNAVSRKASAMTENGGPIIGSDGPIGPMNNGVRVNLIPEIDLQGKSIDENLGNSGLFARSLREIESQVFSNMSDDLRVSKETSYDRYREAVMEPGKEKHTNTGYTILRIDSFEEAKKFSKYTTWCITTSVNSFDEYGMADGQYSGIPSGGRIYFCLRDDFKNVEPPLDETGKVLPDSKGNPLDDYGLSMIAVTVWADDGSCNTITSRWNHHNGGTDDVMEPEDLEKVLGVSFYKAFPGEQD